MCLLGMTVSTLQKKHKRCSHEELEKAGDLWDQTAVAADSTLVVSLQVGNRTDDQTRKLVQDATSRLRPGHVPAMCTDACARDASALLEVCGRRDPPKG